MSQLQSRNEILLQWLRANQVLPEPVLARAWSDLANCGGDLCQALIRHSVWTPEQAHFYLNQARMAYQSGSLSGSDSDVSAVTSITPTPMVPSTTGLGLVSNRGLSGSAAQSPVEKAFSHPNYEIDKEISRGGMGVVFKARGKEDGKAVALKVIKASSPSIEFVERFKLEARALERLDHPNIVGLHGFSWESQTPFIAMEWVDGVPLDEKIKEHLREHGTVPPFDWTRTVHLSLAKALKYCHEQGMVHRDVKPANVLIEKGTGRAVLVDFGLLKRDASQLKGDFQSISEELTKSGLALGTPQYMAPEQLNDKEVFGEIGPKADVWGLGASLYFCLVGHAPYQGSSIQIYKALMDRDPVPPGDINDQIPLALDELCQRCLTRESSDRIGMAEFVKLFANNDLTLSAHRKVSKWLWVFAALAIILAAGSIYWVSLDRIPPKLTVSHTELTMGAAGASLDGTVEDENASHVLVQWEGKKIEVALDEKNQFTLKLDPPKKVKATLRAIAIDKDGNKSDGIKLIVRKDIVAPTILIDSKDSLITYGAEIVIAGRCNEDGSKIVVKPREATVTGNRFEISVPVELGDNSLQLTCTDLYGNQTSQDIKVARRPRLLVGTWTGSKPAGAQAEFKTIQEALRAVKPQSQILIAPGQYPGPVTISKQLSAIEIVGMGEVEFLVQNEKAVEIDGRGILLRSLVFKVNQDLGDIDSRVAKTFGLVTARGRDCVFQDCEFSESPGVAVFLSGPADKRRRKNYDLILRNCVFRGNKLSSVQAESAAYLLIEKCLFENGADTGFYGLGGLAIINDTVFKNNGYGAVIEIGSKAEFKNCKFQANDEAGLRVVGVRSNARIEDSLFDGNGKERNENGNHDRQLVVADNGQLIGVRLVVKNGLGSGVIVREQSILELRGCKVIENNFSGVCVWGESTARLVDCDISRNGAPNLGGRYHGFGVDVRDKSEVTMKKCTLEKNFAKPIFSEPMTKVLLK